MSPSSTAVTHDAAAHRFQIVDEPSAFLQYALTDHLIRLIHTEVPSAVRGHGCASELARAALEYARRTHLQVEPICPFVCSYLARHPEYDSLVENKQELKTRIAP
jgi:uncharacterized protein